MKLLIVLPGGVHPSGEIEVIPVLLNLIKGLKVHHEIVIVALHQHQQLTEYRLFGCQVISLAMVTKFNLVSSCWITGKRLKAYGFNPDVVHSFWLGKPTLLAAMLSKTYQVPLFASVGGGEPVAIKAIGYGGSLSFGSRFANTLGVALAQGISCGSSFVQAQSNQRWKIEPLVIPLGIDIEYWQIKKVQQNSQATWQLVHIGSINKVKDPWVLLGVIKGLKHAGFDFHLDWIGEDTLAGAIEEQAKSMGLSNVICFHGFQTQDQLKQLLQGQHFVIQTSCYESQGVAMAEACSQGLCPVGTDVGWLKDLGLGVEHKDEKGLVASKDVLSAKIAGQIMLLAKDFEARKDTVERAQLWIKANDLAVTVERFNRFYLSGG